jgi:thioredoxin 1
MSVAHIASLAEFKTVIAASRLTVVDFFAKWCGPCKQIAPHIEKLAKEKPNVSFVKVDVDEAQEVAAEYRIRAMPTFMLFKGGKPRGNV